MPVFKSTFEYLNNLKSFCYGFNTNKWDWLLKNSQWFADLSNQEKINTAYNLNDEILLLKSFADSSIYSQLLENLPNSKLKNITIISPYFNKRGDLISNLINDLNPDSIDVIVDSNFGTIPYQFEQDERVKFHEWETVKDSKSNSGARLHAKIFQFQYENSTCILTGSANATIEAFGTKANNSRNAEASILIKSSENKSWIEELKITVPSENSFDFGSYNVDKAVSNNIDYKSFPFKIDHAELDLTELSMYISSKESIPDKSSIVIEKRNDQKSFYPITTKVSSTIISELNELDAELGFRVYIANSLKQRISYYGKIHNQQLIQRTNPDAKSSKFLEILNGTELGDSDLITLLEFANFKENSNVRASNSTANIVKRKDGDDSLKEYKTLSEDEFHENENIIEERYSNASSQLTMLEDFLNNMTFKDAKENFDDSLERIAEDSKDNGIAGSNTVIESKTVLTFQEGQRVKGKLHKTLVKIDDSLEIKHRNLLHGLIERVPSNQKVTIENIQAVLVGTHLFFMKLDDKYYEERFKIVIRYNKIEDLVAFEKLRGVNLKRLDDYRVLNSNEVAFSADGNILNEVENLLSKYNGITVVYCDETSSTTIDHTYFNEAPIFTKRGADVCSKKGFLINTVSKLLLLLENEIEDYSPKEFTRFTAFKKRLFYRVLVLFSSLKWSNKEQQLAEVFLLNVFFILMPDSISKDEVILEYLELKSKIPSVSSKSDAMINRVLNSYSSWISAYNNDKKALIHLIDRSTIGRIIFKSKLGFSIVTSNYKGTLNLKTPLGFFNKETQNYEIKKVKGGLKAIMYKG